MKKAINGGDILEAISRAIHHISPLTYQIILDLRRNKGKEKEILCLKISTQKEILKKDIHNYMQDFLQKHLPNLLINSFV